MIVKMWALSMVLLSAVVAKAPFTIAGITDEPHLVAIEIAGETIAEYAPKKGMDVEFATREACAGRENEACREIEDMLSLWANGRYYTPTLKHATVEDYTATRLSMLELLRDHYNYRRYLEIGCDKDETFSPIAPKFDLTVGVDPVQGGSHRMGSDEFFAENTQTFDLIFIDGLHSAEQVLRDVDNSLLVLEEGGTIVLHDCNPRHEISQLYPFPPDGNKNAVAWNGDVWKAIVNLRTRPGIEVVVGDFDFGVGVLRRRPNLNPLPLHLVVNLSLPGRKLAWSDLLEHREDLLRLMTLQDLRCWLEDEGETQSIGYDVGAGCRDGADRYV